VRTTGSSWILWRQFPHTVRPHIKHLKRFFTNVQKLALRPTARIDVSVNASALSLSLQPQLLLQQGQEAALADGAGPRVLFSAMVR